MNDLKDAFRTLKATPIVTLVAILSLALGIGGAISWGLARFVSTLLYGLDKHDPLTLGGAAVILSSIGALAGWLPARRASRIDPAKVLREG